MNSNWVQAVRATLPDPLSQAAGWVPLLHHSMIRVAAGASGFLTLGRAGFPRGSGSWLEPFVFVGGAACLIIPP